MKKTIYLHIGSGKTGTTSIQNILKHNIRYLKDNDFSYFVRDEDFEPNHHYLVSVPYSNDMWNTDEFKYINLINKFINSTTSNMIISTENIMGYQYFT